MLVHVRDADGARRAEEGGAKGIVVRSGEMDLRVHTHLPLLAYGPAPEEAADTDAVVLTVDDPAALRAFAERCEELGLEYVVRVRDDEELEHVRDVTVWLSSRIGDPVDQPATVALEVRLDSGVELEDLAPSMTRIVKRELARMPDFCDELASGVYEVC